MSSAYLIWCPDYGETEEDATRLQCRDARDAVGEWVEEADRDADFSIARGKPAMVCVRTPEGALLKYKVRGDWSPNYYAERVDDEPPAVSKERGCP